MTPFEVQEALEAATKKSMAGFVGHKKSTAETRECVRCRERKPLKDVFVTRYEGKRGRTRYPVWLCYSCAIIGRDIIIGRGGE